MTDEIQGKKWKRTFVPAGTECNGRIILEDVTRRKQVILCRCKCGREATMGYAALSTGKSQNCRKCSPFIRNVTHGDSRLKSNNTHRIYIIYRDARARCNNPKAHGYSRYGGRGIRICEEWANDYEAFREWALANGYSDGLTLDRHPDKDGNYEPSNCRWASYRDQCRNKTNNRFIAAFGETKIMEEWLEDERCVTTRATLTFRLKQGWPPETALTKPVGRNGPKPKKPILGIDAKDKASLS